MARPYAGEMAKLAETFDRAAKADLDPLCQAVRTSGLSPLRAIGSGGFLTGAHALAGLHQRYTGHLAAVATPLEVIDEPLDASVATWLLSAGGGNVDILAAAKTLILREPRQIGVLCGRESSPLAELCRQHPFVDLLLYPSLAGKDGFLATNSLFGFAALLTRAYATEFGSEADWQEVVACRNHCFRVPLLLWRRGRRTRRRSGRDPPRSFFMAPPHGLERSIWSRTSRKPQSDNFRSPTIAISPTAGITGSPSEARRALCSPSSPTRIARSPN